MSGEKREVEKDFEKGVPYTKEAVESKGYKILGFDKGSNPYIFKYRDGDNKTVFFQMQEDGSLIRYDEKLLW